MRLFYGLQHFVERIVFKIADHGVIEDVIAMFVIHQKFLKLKELPVYIGRLFAAEVSL
jgi:hypothetical protein